MQLTACEPWGTDPANAGRTQEGEGGPLGHRTTLETHRAVSRAIAHRLKRIGPRAGRSNTARNDPGREPVARSVMGRTLDQEPPLADANGPEPGLD